MEEIKTSHWRRLHGELGEIVYELTRVRIASWRRPEGWSPAINAYRCQECIIICVDLAGVDKDSIHLRVEPRRVSLRGHRPPPEPIEREQKALQILAMEIDYGCFERELALPLEVDSQRVTAEQRNGLLWIRLPLQSQA